MSLVTTSARSWNHDTHYHPVILEAVPSHAQRALDVGCGEGALARELWTVVPHVTGIDVDQVSVDLAQEQNDTGRIDYVLGDFLTFPFEPSSFDFVVSVAALHHMDASEALGRMRHLLRPGGTLVIVGLATPNLPADLPFVLAGAVATRFYQLTKTEWEHPSPMVGPSPETFAGMRLIARRTLPGVRFRRHLLWRYSLIWTTPPD